MRWLTINQVFSYKFDTQECESAEAEMCCFSSVITVCHQVICSGLEGKTLWCCKIKKKNDTVADEYVLFSVTVGVWGCL